MVASKSTIVPAAQKLTHQEACRLANLAAAAQARSIILDLTRTSEATTAAFARLVLLRRELLKTGRDLRLAGLHDRPARLFEVHRLDGVLPRIGDAPSTSQSRSDVRITITKALHLPTHGAPTASLAAQ